MKDRRLSLIAKVSIIIVWILISRIVDKEVIVPSIRSTFISIWEIIREPSFLNTIKYTLFRALAGFLISLFLGVATGILSSISKVIFNLMEPILKFLNSIPTIAIILLALIWLNNEYVPMFVGFVMVFPVIYEAVLNSILNVDRDIIEMSYLYKVSKIGIVKNIYMPNILYNLSSILKGVLGINLKMVIAGEVLAQPKYAIGSSLQLQRIYLNTSGVFAWIVIILLISGIFDYIVRGIKYSIGIDKWK